MQDIGGANSKILEKQLWKNRGKSVNKQFDQLQIFNFNQLKKFILTLHYYSPRAYEFVHQEFDNCSPYHCKTISKWYRSIQGKLDII